MNIRIADIIDESIVDGPGFRMSVFVQGCSHRCEGCHNARTWDFDGGHIETVENIVQRFNKNPLLDGVTITGGEPFDQASASAHLAKQIKDLGKTVVTYSGYCFEELMEKSKTDPGIKTLLDNTDILVDGEFKLQLRSLDLDWRGSSNQRVIDVKKSIETGNIVIVKPE